MSPQPTRCKDCAPDSKRPAPHPGPRCVTHHRAVKKARKDKAHEKRTQSVYGLKPGEYDRLYQLQGRRCAICKRATGKTRRLSVDHDHACCPGPVSCGQCVRGLLCRPCNDLLGHARDELDFFIRAHLYLFNPPATQLRE